MNEEKKKNINKAVGVWRMLMEGKSMSIISKELNMNKSEISNIKKYTIVEMYMREKDYEECLEDIVELRKFKKIATNKIKFLLYKLQECEKPWWQKLMEWLG